MSGAPTSPRDILDSVSAQAGSLSARLKTAYDAAADVTSPRKEDESFKLHHSWSNEMHELKSLLDKVLHEEASLPRKVEPAELIQLFETQWASNAQFGHTLWAVHRGMCGGTILHTMEMLKSVHPRDTPFGTLLVQLSTALLRQRPELFKVAYAEEPFTGQTLLMLACANGDEEAVDFLLKFVESEADVNVSASGKFIIEKMMPPCYPEVHMEKASLLEVAAVAPIDKLVAERIVLKLMERGADPEPPVTLERSAHSLLLRLAVSRWREEPSGDHQAVFGNADGEFLEADRLRILIRHVLSRTNAKGRLARQESGIAVDKLSLCDGDRTPLQMAAIVGNDVFIVEYLRHYEKVVWQWGHRREVKVPLKEIDLGPIDQLYPSVLEVLALYKHKKTLQIGIFASLVADKWNRFGARAVWVRMIMQTLYIVMVTVGCLGRSAGMEAASPLTGIRLTTYTRRGAIVIALFLTASEICNYFAMRKTAWNKMMKYIGTNTQLGFDEVGRRMDALVIFMGLFLSLMHEFEVYMSEGKRHYNANFFMVADAFSAVFIYISWMVLLRFLKLFPSTTVLISSLPTIIRQDMPPWFIVYIVILIATAGSIRVSVWHEVDRDNAILGDFYKAALTLEEATHGPDIQWRNIVMQQPLMAAGFFLMFLWLVTIIMSNLLINIFSNTFEVRRKNAAGELLFWRTVEVITLSKQVPDFLPEWLRMHISHHHNAEPTDRTALKAKVSHTKDYVAITECVGYDEWSQSGAASQGLDYTTSGGTKQCV